MTLGVSLDVETRAWSNRIWESKEQDSYVMEFTDFFCVSEPKRTVCYPDMFVTKGIDLSTIKAGDGEEEDSPRIGLPAQTPLD